MSESEVVGRFPLPLAQSFLACREIYHDPRVGVILVGPIFHVPLTQFPAHVRLSIFAEFTGGHGTYKPRLCLRDEAGEEVWGWTPSQPPFLHIDPLRFSQVEFDDLLLAVPRPGRYTLALLLNGDEAAQRRLSFGPLEKVPHKESP